MKSTKCYLTIAMSIFASALWAENNTNKVLYFECKVIGIVEDDIRINDLIEGDVFYDVLKLTVLKPRESYGKTIKIALHEAGVVKLPPAKVNLTCSFGVKETDIGSFLPEIIWESKLIQFRYKDVEIEIER